MRYQPRAVIVASERMDGERGWVPREAGELLHVDGDFAVMRRPSPSVRPQRPVAVRDLDLPAAIEVRGEPFRADVSVAPSSRATASGRGPTEDAGRAHDCASATRRPLPLGCASPPPRLRCR